MNREGDFDQILRTWMDEGADVAPERFVQAAVDQAELTAQRGSWRVALEGMIMRLQPAAPILGIAAIAIAAIALYAAFAGQNTGTPTPTPRVVTTDELSSIVVTDVNAPEGLVVDGTETGAQALVYGLPPGGPAMDQTGFLDAELTTLSTSAAEPALASWGVVFKTADDAQAAYAYLAGRHEAADGWGLEPIDGASSLGDEGVAYRGAAYGWDEAGIYLWRVNNVVLAAIGVGRTDDAALLEVAQGMDARAH